MKRILATLTTITAVLIPLLASASTWNIDPEHSNVGFKVRHMMVSNVKGEFGKFSGKLELDERDIAKSKVEVNIDVISIVTGVAKRDEHLRSADFFDTAKYPTISFVSSRVKKMKGERLQVTGLLTMHGVTKEVTLEVEGPAAPAKDPWGNIRRGVQATTRVSRKDFGLTWNAALETGGVAVGDEVTIALEIELIRK